MASEEEQQKQKELLSSLVADIKSYSGDDPLRPWLHGIKKMKSVLPLNTLKEKLPRFLQKCAQTFESDEKYQNDARYLRVWINLMDYVDDAKVLLKKMERNKIGLKRSSFYIAYALYYEKLRKLEQAEKMYHIGVQNLAEPVSDLQKYYGQFLQRVEIYKKRKSKMQEMKFKKGESKSDNIHKGEGTSKNPITARNPKFLKKSKRKTETLTRFNSENTIMVRKFVDLAIDDKSRAENVLHLGLVEPTVHTKEAMSDILGMFQKDLDFDFERKLRGKNGNRGKLEGGFEIYVDEENREGNNGNNSKNNEENWVGNGNENNNGGFEIYVDEENRVENDNGNRYKNGNEICGFEIYVDEENRVGNGNNENGGFEIYVDEESRVKNGNKGKLEGGFEIYVDEENRVKNNENKKEGVFEIYVDEENRVNQNDENGPSRVNLKPKIKQKYDENCLQIPNENPRINISKGENAKMGKNCALKDKKPIEDGLFEPTDFTKMALDDINEMFGKPLDF
ncbi:hypothetical protein LUZ60_015370 [Juncus effusus]|nr:hypothetical protein LUZ60_015370 [Juncus effusus]